MTQRSLVCDGVWSHATFLCRRGVVSDLIVPFFSGGHQYHTVLSTKETKEIEVAVNCLDEGVISKSKSSGKYLLES